MASHKFICGDNKNHVHIFSQRCRVCPDCGAIGTSEPVEEIVDEKEVVNN